jgi:hypothetical protein
MCTAKLQAVLANQTKHITANPATQHPRHRIHALCAATLRAHLLPPLPACSALRGWLLSVYDVRAAAIEVAWRWLDLAGPLNDFSTPSSSSSSSGSGERPKYQQQLLAMEALTIYCPLGHALGLGVCAAGLEDAAFKVSMFVVKTQSSCKYTIDVCVVTIPPVW